MALKNVSRGLLYDELSYFVHPVYRASPVVVTYADLTVFIFVTKCQCLLESSSTIDQTDGYARNRSLMLLMALNPFQFAPASSSIMPATFSAMA
jgi:hypothetical protein